MKEYKPYINAEDECEIIGCGRYKDLKIIKQVSQQAVKDCDGKQKKWKEFMEGRWIYTSRDKRIPTNLPYEFCPNAILNKNLNEIFNDEKEDGKNE